MPVSVIELREQARLLEVELARLATLSDSLDTRSGVVIGFAGLLAGLLVQVKQSSTTLNAAAAVALASAFVGLVAAFPRRFESPDPEMTTDLYERLPEVDATSLLARAILRAVKTNNSITNSKRALLTLSVAILVAAIILSVLAVK